MNQEYFVKFTDMAKKAQEPIQAIAELNVKTLQGLTYLKPDDIVNIKKPEQLLVKQIELALDNGQKAIDYMQNSFDIIEKAMLSLVQETKIKTDDKK